MLDMGSIVKLVFDLKPRQRSDGACRNLEVLRIPCIDDHMTEP